MLKRFATVLLCVLLFGLSGLAQPKKAAAKKMAPSGPVPDKALMQKIWDAWATLDPANAAPYYAQGEHVFYDLAPVKYNSWSEYEAGAKTLLMNYKSANFTVNDDAAVHAHGDLVWGTATVKEDAMLKSGKREMATIRWTVIWEKQEGKWLIVHEHVSESLQ
jgi:ketosteroid isomerase-like protein